MTFAGQRRELAACLHGLAAYWHPQPFREIRPAWCGRHPQLAEALLALPAADVEHLNHDQGAAVAWLGRYLPEVAALTPWLNLPLRARTALPDYGPFWARDIPGRKQAQIEAFAGATESAGLPVIDWCGGKGHLSRFLARHWQQPATCLEINPALCQDGRELAKRQGIDQEFRVGNVLEGPLPEGGQVLALHACGHLHRRLIGEAGPGGVAALDVAPCCYHLGLQGGYAPLAGPSSLVLSVDDVRLAVTETVTASPRLARRRDREMAWKLGFDAWRREATGTEVYQPFKPVPVRWWAGEFSGFLTAMAERAGLPTPGEADCQRMENRGWQRQGEVMRLSILRHAFRRSLEFWLVLDLASYLNQAGYGVKLGVFCPRELTPRNILLSARR